MSRPPLQKTTGSGPKSGDLRSLALSAHNRAQDVWGKKKAAGANNVLDTIEPEKVEGYALDFAMRKLWEIQRNGDDTAQCVVNVEMTKKLRAIVIETLAEHQNELTQEHTFEIPDPEVVEQREKEKREKAIADMKERQARREAIEKEKKEREAKMQAQKEEEEKMTAAADEGQQEVAEKKKKEEKQTKGLFREAETIKKLWREW